MSLQKLTDRIYRFLGQNRICHLLFCVTKIINKIEIYIDGKVTFYLLIQK